MPLAYVFQGFSQPSSCIGGGLPRHTWKQRHAGAASVGAKTQGSAAGGYAITFRTKAVALAGAHASVSFQLLGSICNSEVEAVSADHFANACTTFLEYATVPFCGDVHAVRLQVSGRGCLTPPRLALLGVEVACLATHVTYCFPAVVVDRRNSFRATLQRPSVRQGVHAPPHQMPRAAGTGWRAQDALR